MEERGPRPGVEGSLERQLAECRERVRRLTESERGHRRFIENLAEGYFFYRHDRDRVYRYLSPSVRRVLGYSPDEFAARYATLFTDAAVNVDARGNTDRALAGEPQRTFDVEVLARDGAPRRLEITEYPVFDAEGRVELVEGIAHDVTEKRRIEARLIELATIDDLTRLFNRRHVLHRLQEAASLARRHGFRVAVAVVDLDGLKTVNDRYGHAAGDRLICAAAEILKGQFRRGDTVGRLDPVAGRMGGDEFVVGLPYSGIDGGMVAIERLLARISQARVEVAPGVEIALAASAGVAELEPGSDSATVLARADHALYRAKREGRGRAVAWSPDDAETPTGPAPG